MRRPTLTVDVVVIVVFVVVAAVEDVVSRL